MFNHFRKDQRGQAMVELALILPILLLLIMGIIEIGRMYNAYLVIDHATREGARAGSLGATDSEIEYKIKTLSAPLNNSTGIQVSVNPISRVRGQDISVKAVYHFIFYAPMIGNIFGNPLNITSSIISRME